MFCRRTMSWGHRWLYFVRVLFQYHPFLVDDIHNIFSDLHQDLQVHLPAPDVPIWHAGGQLPKQSFSTVFPGLLGFLLFSQVFYSFSPRSAPSSSKWESSRRQPWCSTPWLLTWNPRQCSPSISSGNGRLQQHLTTTKSTSGTWILSTPKTMMMASNLNLCWEEDWWAPSSLSTSPPFSSSPSSMPQTSSRTSSLRFLGSFPQENLSWIYL